MPITFYARGDSSTANNAALNTQGTKTSPTTTLVFDAAPDGNLLLEYNGGLPDPDTVVLVDGIETTFTVEFSGTLPSTNKLSNVNGVDLRSEPVTVITTADGQRFFFLTDTNISFATMDDFPNGAHAIGNVDNTTTVLICFVRGTKIRTRHGEISVEDLEIGDHVLTDDGDYRPNRWIGKRQLSPAEIAFKPQFRPVRISKGAFRQDAPARDLLVSQQHRILLDDWRMELLFAEPEMLVAAKHLVNDTTISLEFPDADVTDYHLMFDRHEIIYAEGLSTESFHPGEMALSALEEACRQEIFELFPELERDLKTFGTLARPVLKAYEADIILKVLTRFN